MSEVAKLLSEALDHPENWSLTRQTIRHDPSGTEWWMGNGEKYFDCFKVPFLNNRSLDAKERRSLWPKAQRVWHILLEKTPPPTDAEFQSFVCARFLSSERLAEPGKAV